jgi:hypothetical protein
MEITPILKTSKDIIQEKKEDIPFQSVKFSRTWAFWESYSGKNVKLRYEKANKQIFSWNDLITFFQFWNKYPGNNPKNIFFDGNDVKYFFNEKYRIIAMNIFQEGIKPMWEDEKNKGGKYLQFEYQIKKIESEDFCRVSSTSWKKLILNTMGENYPGSQFVNGLRFVDKTDFERGKIVLFRIEIWVNKFLSDDLLNQLKEFMMKQMGCEVIEIKDIK